MTTIKSIFAALNPTARAHSSQQMIYPVALADLPTKNEQHTNQQLQNSKSSSNKTMNCKAYSRIEKQSNRQTDREIDCQAFLPPYLAIHFDRHFAGLHLCICFEFQTLQGTQFILLRKQLVKPCKLFNLQSSP